MLNMYLTISLIFICNFSIAFESAGNVFYIDNSYSGHEEITRQALNRISEKFKVLNSNSNIFNLSELLIDLKAEPTGLLGYKSKNMIIHGNFASDFPKQTRVLNLADFWKNPNIANFEDPNSQAIHFLKNYNTKNSDGYSGLDSSFDTCLKARDNIKYVTKEALNYWQNGDLSKSFFLIGHALHTIQDSFSPAHTVRDLSVNNNILRICFFGQNMAKKFELNDPKYKNELCYHQPPDTRDAIWSTNPNKYKETLKNWNSEEVSQCNKYNDYPETEDSKKGFLKHEARLARVASEKYLFLIFNQLSPQNLNQKNIESFLAALDTNLFDGPVGEKDLDQKMPNGIMRCEGLSKEILYGSLSHRQFE